MAIQFPNLKKTPKPTHEPNPNFSHEPNPNFSHDPNLALTSPYTAPTANMDFDGTDDFGQYNDSKFYSPTGRIGRIKYLLYPMGFMLCAMMIFGLALTAMGGFAMLLGSGSGTASSMPILLVILVIVLVLALLYINITATVRRLNDLNRSGWLALLLFVPVVSNIFPFYLIFAPGDKGRNDYGLPSAPPTTLMKVLAILMFGGVMLTVIGAAIALPAYQAQIEKAKTAQAQAAQTQANASKAGSANPATNPAANPTDTPTAEPATQSNQAMPSGSIAQPTAGAMPAGDPNVSGNVEKPLLVETTANRGGDVTQPNNAIASNAGTDTVADPVTDTPANTNKKTGSISYEEFTKLSEGKVYQDPVHVKK